MRTSVPFILRVDASIDRSQTKRSSTCQAAMHCKPPPHSHTSQPSSSPPTPCRALPHHHILTTHPESATAPTPSKSRRPLVRASHPAIFHDCLLPQHGPCARSRSPARVVRAALSAIAPKPCPVPRPPRARPTAWEWSLPQRSTPHRSVRAARSLCSLRRWS